MSAVLSENPSAFAPGNNILANTRRNAEMGG